MAEKEKPPRPGRRPKRHHLHIMMVPHGGAQNRGVHAHTAIVVVLVAAGVGILAYAGFVVSGYWKNIINLSQLTLYERRDRDEQHKLEVMERGIGELDELHGRIDGQYETVVEKHRLTEVRPPEALLPADQSRDRTLEGVETRAARLGRNLGRVRSRFDGESDGLALIPSIVPSQGWFYRDFGNTVSPFTGRLEMHRGVDIVAPRGTPVLAAAAGVVTASGLEEHYGLTVQIDHGNGYVTRYSHNMRNVAQVGARVKRGQVIAYVGSTGRSSCTHVHYEVVRNGVPVNPRYFILREPPLRAGPKPVPKAKTSA